MSKMIFNFFSTLLLVCCLVCHLPCCLRLRISSPLSVPQAQ